MVVFFLDEIKLAFLTPPNCGQISTSSFLHPTQNFKMQWLAESDFQISTPIPVKKPVSRSYPKIIGFWTSSGPIGPKLGQSNVPTPAYWCLKYDTTRWLIRGHITKRDISTYGWLTDLFDRSKWSQLNALSAICNMIPLWWFICLREGDHITFDNILSYIQFSYLFQSLKWSGLNELSPNCNITPPDDS